MSNSTQMPPGLPNPKRVVAWVTRDELDRAVGALTPIAGSPKGDVELGADVVRKLKETFGVDPAFPKPFGRQGFPGSGVPGDLHQLVGATPEGDLSDLANFLRITAAEYVDLLLPVPDDLDSDQTLELGERLTRPWSRLGTARVKVSVVPNVDQSSKGLARAFDFCRKFIRQRQELDGQLVVGADLGDMYLTRIWTLLKLGPLGRQMKLVTLVAKTPGSEMSAQMGARLQGKPQQTVAEIQLPKAVSVDADKLFDVAPGHRLKELSGGGTAFEYESFDGLGGTSRSIREVQSTAAIIALTDHPILLVGPVGVGKAVIARGIHQISPRAEKPFIHVNCQSLRNPARADEFFGWVSGANPGSTDTNPGKIAAADGGTLFLSGIANAPPRIQDAVLHLIDTSEFTPLGTGTPTRADVRIVASSHDDPIEHVRGDRLSRELYDRLDLFKIQIPPLRERAEDIEPIANAIVESINRKLAASKDFKPKRLSKYAHKLLRKQVWPENVRELNKVLTRCITHVAIDADSIHGNDLKDYLPTLSVAGDSLLDRPLGPDFDLDELLESVERHYLQRAVSECRRTAAGEPVMVHAAELLGIDRTKLLRRVKDYNITAE